MAATMSLYAYILFLKKLDEHEPELVNIIKDFLFTKYSMENKPYIYLNQISLFYCNIENIRFYVDENNNTFENYIPDYIKTYNFVIIYEKNEKGNYIQTIKNQYLIKDIQELKHHCFNYFNKFKPDILEINRKIKIEETGKQINNNNYNQYIIKYDKAKKLKLAYNKQHDRDNSSIFYNENIINLTKLKRTILNTYLKKQNKYSFM